MNLEEMKEIKEQRGYSLAQLSEYSGVPLGTLQKIFSGETANPRYATQQAIEKVLKGDEKDYQGKAYSYDTGSSLPSGSLHEPSASYHAEKKHTTEKKQGEYTLEDYYLLPDEKRVELIDGVFYDMTSPKFVHQIIAGEVHGQIRDYIKKNNGPCVAAISPVDVQLDCDNRTMVQPDVLIVCDKNKIKDFGIFGAPDFVLEIISESTKRKDYTVKLQKYMNAGVREYWIIDPRKKLLLTYVFSDEDCPCIRQLTGKMGLAIYDGALEIDLDEISEIISGYEPRGV